MKFRKRDACSRSWLFWLSLCPPRWLEPSGPEWRPRTSGETTAFIQPAATSSNPNQGVFACFNLDQTWRRTAAAPSPPLYLILNPTPPRMRVPAGPDP